MSIWFSKVAEEYGWMGNMAPFKIKYDGKEWLTSEALFQSMRYEDDSIKEIIRLEKSPMAAKMKAKKFRVKMVVVPMSEKDVENMRICVRLKIEQHSKLKDALIATGNETIYENIGKRNGERHKFWGAKKMSETEGDGFNVMGQILMDLRDEFLLKMK
jgi:ribA/ribD-fused uncharacterized protein